MKLHVVSYFSAAALAAALAVPSFVASNAASAPVRAPEGPETYSIDVDHSTAMFRVKHMNCSFSYGRFNKMSGSFSLDEKNPAASSVEVEVQADSIDTNSEGRDKHLRSADFFSVKEFPTLSFKSKSVKKAGEHVFEVAGDLTIHGVTKPVTFQATHTGTASDPRAGERAGFEAVFAIQKADFGMKYGGASLGEEVKLTISLEGVKKKAK
jgi:polyisoprenoid-binding protein YceI